MRSCPLAAPAIPSPFISLATTPVIQARAAEQAGAVAGPTYAHKEAAVELVRRARGQQERVIIPTADGPPPKSAPVRSINLNFT